jgi:hypothetical protein
MDPEDWKRLITGLAGAGLGAAGYNRANYGVENAPPSGYQGSIPDYSLVREQVLDTYDPKRVPGSRGQRYFSDFAFAPRTTTSTTPTASSGIRGTMQPVDNPQIANIRQTLFNQANVGPDSLRAANYARMGKELPDLAGRGPTGIASVMQGTSPFTGGVATPSGEDADTATITDPNQIQFFGQGVVHVPGYGVVNYLDDASLLNYLATQRGDLTPTDTDTDTDTESTPPTQTIMEDDLYVDDDDFTDGPTQPPGGGPVITCPAPETLINLTDGNTKQAGNLEVGDVLYTQHEDTLAWGEHPVTSVEIVPDQERLKLTFDHVEFICSFSHKFHVDGSGWTEVKDMSVGDSVSGHKLLGVEETESGDVVKIQVEDAHTYISEDMLSHNKSPIPRYMRDPTYIGNFRNNNPDFNARNLPRGGIQIPITGENTADRIREALANYNLTDLDSGHHRGMTVLMLFTKIQKIILLR